MECRVLSDLGSLSMTADFGLGCLNAYVRLNSGQRIPLPWPRGWYVVLQELEADDDYTEEDIKRLGQYPCCEMQLTFVGRVVGDPVLVHGQQKKTLVVLAAEDGQVFCYVEEDGALYFVAKTFCELERVGLRAIDVLYCPRYLRSSAVKRAFRGLRRSGNAGREVVARYVTRHQGECLHLAYPEGAFLRLCNLKCFESSSNGGYMLRSLRQLFGKEVICLGTVDLRGEMPSSPSVLRWPPTRVPIVMADGGRVFCIDLINFRYVRLADGLAAFMCLGLRQLLENRRFTGDHEIHDTIPECPRGRQHDD
ncbi:tegument protein UL24 [Mandrillus leucophaeus cytomegalovirus]|uniref:Tegument protein UL24 n=1 Tax=Mandrillus leucophaeus cytomegalovirus TaxID=1654930 RepID=A0A0G2UI67_9BETA|nr:tegument protein UL24 [Mandrillus leucophaeus cytomegalovirus]AKI29794.1 tegument protein UL24 [Mandrillus leucophaeus cytomegalovirus]